MWMKWLRRLINLCCCILFADLPFWLPLLPVPTVFKIPAGAAAAAGFLFCNLQPVRMEKGIPFRLKALEGGYELLLISFLYAIAEIPVFIVQVSRAELTAGTVLYLVGSGLLMLFCGFVVAVNSCLRIMAGSRQLGLMNRLLWLLCWWIPPVNVWITVRICRIVRSECIVEKDRIQLNQTRKENEVCRTRYPVVLVHGVFFRDWQFFNYWGRVPGELIRNGCTVYYGKQQSAASVEDSAEELERQIEQIVQETGCGKVNVIAHSKGGLDIRYAVEHLSLAPYIASLTTVNSPHRGCLWVDRVLESCPDTLVEWAGNRYNRIFARLGDKNPDFKAAVYGLTAKECRFGNDALTEEKFRGILCQSVMSQMSGMFSDGFPLTAGYPIVRKYEGANDGLVALPSARFGTFLGVLHTQKRRGISHGDMIDLRRQNIDGFDVREFYTGVVRGLKERGL